MTTLRSSTVAHIDLTASLPSLKHSLTPQAGEFSGINSTLLNRAAEEFSLSVCGLMAGWTLGTIALFSVALILWA